MNGANNIAYIWRRWNIPVFIQSMLLVVFITGCPSGPPPINGTVSASPTARTPTSSSPTVSVCCSPTPSTVSNFTPTPTSASTPIPGTVLFTANWSAGLRGWGPPDGVTGQSVWSVSNGMLVCDGSQIGGLSLLSLLERQQLPASNYAVVARIKVTAIDSNISGIDFGLLARESSGGVGYIAGVAGDTSLVNTIFEDDTVSGQERVEVRYNDAVGAWHIYRLEAKNNTIKLFIDNAFMFQETVQQNPFLQAGQNGVAGLGCSGLHLLVSSFQVTAL